MNPELSGSADELEPKLTALLLGQLPLEEAATVREAIAQNPKLTELHERLKKTIDLVRAAGESTEQQAVPKAPLKLSEVKRAALLAHLKTVEPTAFGSPKPHQPSWFVPLAAAAILALLGAVAAVWLPLTEIQTRNKAVTFLPSAGLAYDSQTDYLYAGSASSSVKELKDLIQDDGAKLFKNSGNGRFQGSEAIRMGQSDRGRSADSRQAWSMARRAGQFQTSEGSDEQLERARTEPGLVAGRPLAREDETLIRGLSLSEGEAVKAHEFNRAASVVLPPNPASDTAGQSLGERYDSAGINAMEGTEIRKKEETHQLGWAAGGGFGGGGGAVGYAYGAAPTVVGNLQKAPAQATAWNYGSFQNSLEQASQPFKPDPDSGVAFVPSAQTVPVLGDLPIAGKLFRSAAPETGASVWFDYDRDEYRDLFEATQPDRPIAETQLEAKGKSAVQNGFGEPTSGDAIRANIDHAGRPVESLEKVKVPEVSSVNAAGYYSSPTPTPAPSATGLPALPAEAVPGLTNRTTFAFGGVTVVNRGEAAAASTPEAEAFRRSYGLALGPPPTSSTASEDKTPSVQGQQGVRKGVVQQIADLPAAKRAVAPAIPQPEIRTADNPFSTFSMNVADVSFKLATASLENGQMPEPSSIRSEEFINAFDYHDPEASPGVPFAFAWERARYPFAHNRDLLRFSLKTAAQGRAANTPLNLVLLLDKSGSMERTDRVNILQQAIQVLSSQLQVHDKLSIVTFSRNAQLRVDGMQGQAAAKAADEIARQTPEGGTNLEEALKAGYETALRHYVVGGVNRVILLTDGAANLGNVLADALKPIVERHRKQGVALDCFGIGWEGYNDELLEVLARNGDGRYGFLNSPEAATSEFAAKLAGALRVAASDVKVQVQFNPDRVNSYRQLGYAKHQLTKEQFRDNTVDAAEIAAAESGNALYVIESRTDGKGPLATVRVRYKDPATGQYEEHEWVVPYTGSTPALEQATPTLRLAGTAAAFAEWLAASPYAGDVTIDRLMVLLTGVKETFGADPRPAKLEWMIRQAGSISGG